MNEEQFWKKILYEIDSAIPVVLVVIIEREGSAPNVPGAKMYVTSENVQGTVGGGLTEFKLTETARKMIIDNITKNKKIRMVHDDTAEDDKSGMICSGSQTFALVPLSTMNKETVENITIAYAKSEIGILKIDDRGLSIEFDRILSEDNVYIEENGLWSYQENLGVRNRLFCIGGGHVSLALSKIMETLDFHITIYDDRKDLPTMISNTYANEMRVISYDKIEEFIPEGENIYVTIMTFGHQSDQDVLEKLIRKKIKYIGMMASPAKKKQVFDNLHDKGVPEQFLGTVHSPIGVKINSDTPEEIAISIAAEIIKVKNS